MEKNIVRRERLKKKTKRKNVDDKINGVKQWSDLSNDLLESIKKRLFYADQCKLGAVCKSWSSIQEEEEERIDVVPPLQQMPWLLVFDEPDSCKLIDSKYKKIYTISTKTIKEKMNINSFITTTIHESKYGWLLISSRTYIPHTESLYFPARSLFLFSPFNNKFIKLPILNEGGRISLAAFTSNPLDEDFTVVILNITSNNKAICVNTYRRGHTSWDSRVFQCEFSLEIVKCWMYSEGKFYYTTDSGGMGTFDLARKEWNVFPSPPLRTRDLSAETTFYMVKPNDNELLLIVEEGSIRGNCYSRNHICKLHLLWLIWEDSTSIGDDRVLFVGYGYNCVLNSSGLKSNGVLQKGISDTIYYCSGQDFTYCTTVEEYPAGEYVYHDKEYFRRQSCSRHYGLIAGNQCMKVLIDPPSSSSSARNRVR